MSLLLIKLEPNIAEHHENFVESWKSVVRLALNNIYYYTFIHLYKTIMMLWTWARRCFIGGPYDVFEPVSSPGIALRITAFQTASFIALMIIATRMEDRLGGVLVNDSNGYADVHTTSTRWSSVFFQPATELLLSIKWILRQFRAMLVACTAVLVSLTLLTMSLYVCPFHATYTAEVATWVWRGWTVSAMV